MTIRVGILDQTPIYEGETAEQSFQHTLQLAQLAERLGYQRFWVAEHHDSTHVSGSSPEVLISHLLAHTNKLVIGSGGVMLQHYSPYKVAENFNVLAALAPGRVELGIGRAPGGLPRSTRALQGEQGDARSLTDKLEEMRRFLRNDVPDDHPLTGIHVSPQPAQPAPLFLLGASRDSAELAARQGLPYVFSLFINGDEQLALEAIEAYRNGFVPSPELATPHAILALSVIVADTDEQADELAGENLSVKIHLHSGRVLTVATVEQAEEFGRQSNEPFRIEVKEAKVVKGAPASVYAQLSELRQRFGIDELVVHTVIRQFEQRVRSFELLQQVFTEHGENEQAILQPAAVSPLA
ncbi:LLM class flavin-dependent oxidoreductase [Paenibacillus campi]|uniref:LLM class flavin-dependent oxidoreductase n=1 Tax=Paenibacillus campi TaxID=3106031 RepID=UPI002AFEF16A|nr:LLM class flavin-dependent oxidoreductase [Paenibacillus sp. SGZ-1014]